MNLARRIALSALLTCCLAPAWGCVPFAKKSEAPPPPDAAALERQGDQALQEGRPEAALALYQNALKAGMPKPRVDLKSGRALLAAGSPEQALPPLRAAQAAAPDDPEPLLLLGWAGLRLGDFPEAEKRLAQAIALKPDSVQAHSLMGIAQNRLSRPEKALGEFSRALALGGPDAAVLNNMGLSAFMLGRYGVAEDSFRRAVSLDPNPRYKNNLGLALCRLKRYREAFETFKSAHGEVAAHNNVGCCYLDDGQRQMAQTHFEKAVALSPRFYKPASDNLARLGLKEGAATTAEASALPPLREQNINAELESLPARPQTPPAAIRVPTTTSSQPVLPPGDAPADLQAQPAPSQNQPQAARPGSAQTGNITSIDGVDTAEAYVLRVAASPVPEPSAVSASVAEGAAVLSIAGRWAFPGLVVQFGASPLVERITTEQTAQAFRIVLTFRKDAKRPAQAPVFARIPQGFSMTLGK